MKRSRLGKRHFLVWAIFWTSFLAAPLSSIKTMPFSSRAKANCCSLREKFDLLGMQKVPVMES